MSPAILRYGPPDAHFRRALLRLFGPRRNIAAYELGVSGLWLLWRKLRALVTRDATGGQAPTYFALDQQLKFIAHQTQLARTLAARRVDLLLRPPDSDLFTLMDYHKGDEIAARAYAYAAPAVAAWQEGRRAAADGGGED